jgi:hypothetical protein
MGLQLRAAETKLERRALRWRIAPGKTAYSKTLPPDVHSSEDDLPVIGQSPKAGTPTTRGTIVVIRTPCTAKTPCA